MRRGRAMRETRFRNPSAGLPCRHDHAFPCPAPAASAAGRRRDGGVGVQLRGHLDGAGAHAAAAVRGHAVRAGVPACRVLPEAAGGLGVIIAIRGGEVSPLGLALVLAAALSWAGGNIVGRSHPPGTNMLAYVVWASVFAVPPLFLLSLIFEGWPAIAAGLRGADALTWGALLYQSFGNSLFGYGAWAWLLARHPAATVSPFALLVPEFGMATSALVMPEPLQ